MSRAPAPDEIARDARWLAQALDGAAGLVRFVAMDRVSYRAASFLDDRIIQQSVNFQVLAWPALEAAMQGDLRTDARWIFHIGHVGSTLVSRLLGEIDNVLSVREPRLLRDVAMLGREVREAYVPSVPKLMSRTFASDEIACVKATSFASEIARELVPVGESALFIHARFRNYVGTILAGENSVRELGILEQSRAERLVRRGIHLPAATNPAQRAAAAWACEMVTLEEAAKAMPDRHVRWAEFDDLLSDLPRKLGSIAAFFGFSATEDQLRSIASGPVAQRYSKDPSFAYSPKLRQSLIEQELKLQRRDIDEALAMLIAKTESSPLLARALRRSEGN